MNNIEIYEGITIEGDAVRISVVDSKISEVESIEENSRLPRLLPVLVDLQQNGAFGFPYNNLREDAETRLNEIGAHLLKHGVGRVLATFTTSPYDNLTTAAGYMNDALKANPGLESLFCGIFHEGVFISPEPGWRGGHDPAYIIPPDWEKFNDFNKKTGNRVKVVNVAPETSGSLEFIEKAVRNGIKVALGHCAPDTETINAAVDRGATMVTHFANGVSPTIHRFKNPLWGLLDNDKLVLGLIGDGFHLPPEVVGTALKTKGLEGCFMVSDASPFSGCKPGSYKRLGGCDCVIKENGFIHVAEQEILAGAWFQLDRSVEYLINQVGLPFEDAWRLCSVTPAKLADMDLPMLREGDEATFTQARFTDGKLKIQQTVLKGEKRIDTDA